MYICDKLPPDVLEHLSNNKRIITGAKSIPDDIAMGVVDVDSMLNSMRAQTSDPAETITMRLLEGIPLT